MQRLPDVILRKSFTRPSTVLGDWSPGNEGIFDIVAHTGCPAQCEGCTQEILPDMVPFCCQRIVAILENCPFLNLLLKSYTTVCAIEWSSHRYLCLTNRCSTSGACLHFCSMEVDVGKIWISVTSAYSDCTTGKWYHLIELDESFLLKCRRWTFAKTTASTLWKKFLTSDITTKYRW